MYAIVDNNEYKTKEWIYRYRLARKGMLGELKLQMIKERKPRIMEELLGNR